MEYMGKRNAFLDFQGMWIFFHVPFLRAWGNDVCRAGRETRPN